MPWECRMVEPYDWTKEYGTRKFRPGDMYEQIHYLAENMSGEYQRDHAGKRLPLMVVMPDGSHFGVDWPASDEPGGGKGWTVTGEAPRITVNPSIHIVGYYHGWLRDGVLSDDVDGRTFPKWDRGQ